MNPKRSTPWIWIVLSVLVLLFVGGLGTLCIGLVVGTGARGEGSHVALIELSGAISDQGAGGFLGGGSSGARKFMSEVAEAERDPSVKAVVIRINSPGGAAAASQEMFGAVRRLHNAKPVVCSMGDLAASGGYYVASACDKIFANGSTLTGSIGVISQFLNYQGLFKKVGLDEATIKSGKFKDAGNPARPLTPEERKLFQTMILNVYNQFVDDVVEGRKAPTKGKLTKARLLRLADGRVYTGQQAVANSLVDTLGGLHEALQEAGRLGGIPGRPDVRYMGNAGFFSSVLSSQAAGEAPAQSSAFEGSLAEGVSHLSNRAGSAFADGFMARVQAEAGAGNKETALQAR